MIDDIIREDQIVQIRKKLKDCVTYVRHGKICSFAKETYFFRDQLVACDVCGVERKATWVFYFDDDNVSIKNINICTSCASTIDEAVELMSIAVIKRDLSSD